MSNQLQIFKNNEFGEIRTAIINSEPHLMLNDVCRILDIKNVSDTKSRLKEDGVGSADIIDSLGRTQQATFINEPNFYKVVFQSRKPQAEKFTDWVASEVLPSIRKHGMYAKDELLDNPDLLLDVIQKYKAEREEKLTLQKQAELDKPKLLFAKAWEVSEKSILVGEMAKLLARNGLEEMGQNRFFRWLRSNGYLHKTGEQYNLPTQKSIELKIVEVKTTTITNTDGSVRVTKTPKITVKGQMYFLDKFREQIA